MHLSAESANLHVRTEALPSVKVLGGGAVAPTAEETERNPRARSAKLRVAEKIVEG